MAHFGPSPQKWHILSKCFLPFENKYTFGVTEKNKTLHCCKVGISMVRLERYVTKNMEPKSFWNLIWSAHTIAQAMKRQNSFCNTYLNFLNFHTIPHVSCIRRPLLMIFKGKGKLKNSLGIHTWVGKIFVMGIKKFRCLCLALNSCTQNIVSKDMLEG